MPNPTATAGSPVAQTESPTTAAPPPAQPDPTQNAAVGVAAGATALADDSTKVATDVEAAAKSAAPDVQKWIADARAEYHAILDKIENSYSLLDSKSYVAEARAWVDKFLAGPPSKQ